MTLRLWNLLSKPPLRYPLYRRVLRPRSTVNESERLTEHVKSYLPLVYLLGILGLCCALPSNAVVLFSAVSAVLLLNGSLYGLGWSARTAALIATERARGSWELICLLPPGPMGTAWTFASGVFHRDNRFSRLFRRHRNVLITLLAFMLLLLPCSLLDRTDPGELYRPSAVVVYAYLLAALVASYVDYKQSIVLAGMTGILGGLQTDRVFDAQFWAGGVFLALQTAVYAATAFIGFGLLPPISSHVNGDGLIVELGLLALRLALFVGLREAVIAVVWRLLADRLQTTPHDRAAPSQAG